MNLAVSVHPDGTANRRDVSACKRMAEHLATLRANRALDDPAALRRHLSAVFAGFAQEVFGGREVLALLFGSAGRGERSLDLDFLFVVQDHDEIPWRVYERVEIDGSWLDLNVANAVWLEKEGSDLEWAYCLREAFVLGATAPDLLVRWQAKVIASSRVQAFAERSELHRDGATMLWSAAQARRDSPRVSLLLEHEAARCLAMSVIELFGQRVYSHRTFIQEVRSSWRRAGVSGGVLKPLLGALAGTSADEQDVEVQYVNLRNELSSFLRGPLHAAGLYDPSDARQVRLKSMMAFSDDANSELVETLLQKSGIDLSRSRFDFNAALDATRESLTAFIGYCEALARKRRHSTELSIPRTGDIEGARWLDFKTGRLKVILATGGCRTPTCAFCVLPSYGRMRASVSPSVALGPLLERYRPQRLAIYNDGSVFNPAEISQGERQSLWGTVRRGGAKELEVESIPRFVTPEVVEDAVRRTGAKLTVSMGFQCSADSIATGLLGRPDPTVLFDQAIETLASCDVSVRLYLMWGLPPLPLSLWAELLEESLEWIDRRGGVNRVTICPFVDAVDNVDDETGSLCALRRCLEIRVDPSSFELDVAVPEVPTCGVRYAGTGCGPCLKALRTGDYSEHCTRFLLGSPAAVVS